MKEKNKKGKQERKKEEGKVIAMRIIEFKFNLKTVLKKK